MSENIPSIEPTSIRAGDTVQFTKNSAMEIDGVSFSFPSSSYTLKYKLVGRSGITESITAEADGEDFSITISSTISALTAGIYTLIGWVEGASSFRKTVYQSQCEVKANLASATAATDTREFWQKILEAISATLEKRASIVQSAMTVPGISGKTIQYMTLKELMDARTLAEYQLSKLSPKKSSGRILQEFTRR